MNGPKTGSPGHFDAGVGAALGGGRKEMKERSIDALVMQSNTDWLGGYVK